MSRIKAAVCGTGTIGACIATLPIGNGVETVVVGHSESGIRRCRETVAQNLVKLEQAFKITAEQREKILSLLTVTGEYRELAGASFVFEAVAEDVAVKRTVYQKIEEICAEETVLASTTSALPPHILCQGMRHPARLLVAHPFQPAHLLPLFELVGSPETDSASLAKMKAFLKTMLNRQVVCVHKEIEGFIVNRIAQAMFRGCGGKLHRNFTGNYYEIFAADVAAAGREIILASSYIRSGQNKMTLAGLSVWKSLNPPRS